MRTAIGMATGFVGEHRRPHRAGIKRGIVTRLLGNPGNARGITVLTDVHHQIGAHRRAVGYHVCQLTAIARQPRDNPAGGCLINHVVGGLIKTGDAHVGTGAALVLNLIAAGNGICEQYLGIILTTNAGGIAGCIAGGEIGLNGIAGEGGGRERQQSQGQN